MFGIEASCLRLSYKPFKRILHNLVICLTELYLRFKKYIFYFQLEFVYFQHLIIRS